MKDGRPAAPRALQVLADKAARLAGITPAQFWAGPPAQAASAPAPDGGHPPQAHQRQAAGRDSIIATVLAIHAEADRPLSFDQVAELAGNRVTRAQVSAASSTGSGPGCTSGQPADASPGPPAGRVSAAEVFGQLFLSGLR